MEYQDNTDPYGQCESRDRCLIRVIVMLFVKFPDTYEQSPKLFDDMVGHFMTAFFEVIADEENLTPTQIEERIDKYILTDDVALLEELF